MGWLFSSGYTFKDKYVVTVSYGRHTVYISRKMEVETGTNAIISQSANFSKMQRFDILTSVSLFAFW